MLFGELNKTDYSKGQDKFNFLIIISSGYSSNY